MPYKDLDKQKEAAKERQRKHRQGVTKGVTSEGVTGQGVTGISRDAIAFVNTEFTKKMTRIEFIQQELNDPYLIEGIEAACRIKWQIPRDLRYERAYIYKLKREGLIKGSIIGKDINELR